MNPIVVILICLSAMYFLSEILRKLSVPRVISQIVAGIVLGFPLIKYSLFSNESLWLIAFLAEVGVILLLFFVGLQTDFHRFNQNLPTSLWISVFNTLLPLVSGFLAAKYIFGLDKYPSLIIGICLSVSSTALALDIMTELGKVRSKLTTLLVSAGTFDDIVEMFLITGVLTVLETTVKQATLLELVRNVVIFAGAVFAFRKWVIPAFLHEIESQKEHAQLFTGSLIITLLMASLAEFLQIGAMIGALFSGVVIRQILIKEPGHKPWERHEITHTIHTIAFGFFVPFFFFYIGLQTDVLSIFGNLKMSAVFTILAITGTVLGSAAGYYLINKNWREGIIVGWAMNAKGDTELVIATLALSVGAINQEIFSSLIFVAVFSTLISPFILKHMLVKT